MIDKSSSEPGDGCGCDREPELMRRMAVTLDSDDLLKGVERKLAAERCHACTELGACKVWLDITAIRGAVHPPKFCPNAELFEEISNEVASSTI